MNTGLFVVLLGMYGVWRFVPSFRINVAAVVLGFGIFSVPDLFVAVSHGNWGLGFLAAWWIAWGLWSSVWILNTLRETSSLRDNGSLENFDFTSAVLHDATISSFEVTERGNDDLGWVCFNKARLSTITVSSSGCELNESETDSFRVAVGCSHDELGEYVRHLIDEWQMLQTPLSVELEVVLEDGEMIRRKMMLRGDGKAVSFSYS